MDMRLGYFKSPLGNVGDDLNLWLFTKLFGASTFSEDSNNVLIGIGSILDSRWSKFDKKVVFGSGARGYDELPNIDDDWDIKFVRGPLTKKAISSMVSVKYLTDPAILISDFYNSISKPKKVGLIPYYKADLNFWAEIASELGMELISPTCSVEEFSKAICECEFIITEAMHGAIFSDSLRIPWYSFSQVTIFKEAETHSFKWRDWCLSMNMEYEDCVFPQIWRDDGFIKSTLKKNHIKSKIKKITKSKCFLSDDGIFNKNKSLVKGELDGLIRELTSKY